MGTKAYALLLTAALAAGLVACGKSGSKKPTEPGAAYEKLVECDTMNWLGLDDSLSCPKSGGLCQISGLGKVGVNVCAVGKEAWLWTVVTGVSFASETKATLNGSVTKTGPAHGELKFSDFQSKNELAIRIEYKDSLQATEPQVYTKTWLFLAP